MDAGMNRVSAIAWPTLTDDELNAIVDQAHNHHHVRVTAYLGDEEGAQRALRCRCGRMGAHAL